MASPSLPPPPMAQRIDSYQPFNALNPPPLVYNSPWQSPALSRPSPLVPIPQSPHPASSPTLQSNRQSSFSSLASGSSDRSEKKSYYPYNNKYAQSSHSRSKSQSYRDHVELSTGGPPRTMNNGTPSLTNWPETDENRPVVIQYIPSENEPVEDDQDHAVWILCWLSCLDPFYSLFSCIFTLFCLLGIVLLWPVRLCRKGELFSTVLVRTIAPVFWNHLRLMYAPSAKNAHDFDFSASRLIFVHLALPVVSLGMAFFAWVAAVFWLFALMMGNPDGTERRDDGRAAVLGARNYSERYLLSALQNE